MYVDGPKSYSKMTAEQKKWQAEEDVRTICAYHEIMKDKKRLAAAKKCAKEKAEYLQMASGDMGKMSMGNYTKTRKRQTKPKDHYA